MPLNLLKKTKTRIKAKILAILSAISAKKTLLCQSIPQKDQNLVIVLVISMSITEKTEEKLERVSYIGYFIIFKKQTKALLDSKSKIHAMSQVFAF